MGNLRAGRRIAALTAITLAGVPVQWLALRLGLRPVYRALPVLFHRLVCRIIGVRVQVRGEPPGEGGALLVSNHISWVDITAISSVTPLSFIAKSEVAGWPVFGLFARLQRSIFIDRSRRTATAEVNATIAQRLADGDAMVLFAEGTTGEGLRVLPFRSALVGAVTALAGDRPVRLQPMSICYVRRTGLPVGRRLLPLIAWYGDMDLAPHLMELLRSGHVWEAVISFGEPLDPALPRKVATREAETFARESIRRARRDAA
ncbi:lysophospholipid acyltransferase family protein [Camelimonas abortus]|uniref:Lysophospholipid acyltransferase family protein n=1 Tax=Camelimonas abortus TaxID=1017184 RepID=A0ABV7LDT5_9HYPH